MRKTIYSKQSEYLCEMLVAMRNRAGVTQRQLAPKLGREHNMVGRLELGERRLDVIEFYWLCKACGANPEKTAAELMRRLAAIEFEQGA